jgi:lipopolysaccharide biosynthesis regulator YciM
MTRSVSQDRTATVLRGALLAAASHDDDRAESLLAQLVQRDSDDIEAYLALAAIYRRRGEVGRAIAVHQTLVMRRDLARGQRLRVLSELAEDFRAGGYTRRAIAAFEEVLEHDRHHRRALSALVELLADEGEYDRALEMARRRGRNARKQDAAVEAGVLLRMGRRLLESGQPELARRPVRQALKLDPAAAAAHRLMGEVELANGRGKPAMKALRAALRLCPTDAGDLLPRIAEAHALLGSEDGYEPFLREEGVRHPDVGAIQLALVESLQGRGRIDDAVMILRGALDRRPDDLDIHVALGELLLSEQRELDAIDVCRTLLGVLKRRRAASQVDGGEPT